MIEDYCLKIDENSEYDSEVQPFINLWYSVLTVYVEDVKMYKRLEASADNGAAYRDLRDSESRMLNHICSHLPINPEWVKRELTTKVLSPSLQ